MAEALGCSVSRRLWGGRGAKGAQDRTSALDKSALFLVLLHALSAVHMTDHTSPDRAAKEWGNPVLWMIVKCLFQLQPSAPVASPPLPAVTGLIFSHCRTMRFGGCSPSLWENATQGQGCLLRGKEAEGWLPKRPLGVGKGVGDRLWRCQDGWWTVEGEVGASRRIIADIYTAVEFHPVSESFGGRLGPPLSNHWRGSST